MKGVLKSQIGLKQQPSTIQIWHFKGKKAVYQQVFEAKCPLRVFYKLQCELYQKKNQHYS